VRAVERDRLIGRLAWVYLVGLAGVLAFYLWPRSLPEAPAAALDFSELAVGRDIDFDGVEKIDVRATAATAKLEDALRDAIVDLGGTRGALSIPIDRDQEKLLVAFAALRAVSRGDRHVTLLLHLTPGGQIIQLHRGAFDDPGGEIGKRLLARERRLAETSTTVSIDDPETPTR
jgi:hypothetical protein